MLRSYITRFNKEALSIDEADDKILMAAFTNGLRKGKFLFSLYKNDPKTMLMYSIGLLSTSMWRMRCWLTKRSLRREKDRRKHNRIGDERQQGRETDGRTNALNLLLGDSQASPH